jgi:hypothetical protein
MPRSRANSFRSPAQFHLDPRMRGTPRGRAPAIATALVVACVAAPLAAQWQATGPDARGGIACCWDPVREVTVAFGGGSWQSSGQSRHALTWEWNGSGWAQRATAAAPSGRRHAGMAYDPVRGVCLVFGGWSGGALTDTWQWDGAVWEQLAPLHVPTTNGEPFLATDWNRGRVVLSPSGSATWEWNGTDWVQAGSGATPGSNPIAFDFERGKVASFAGNVHWEWNGTTWTSLGSTPVPSRTDHCVAFDTVRNRLCVFGGVVAGNLAKDLWEWNGATWQQRPSAPAMAGRRHASLVFDQRRGRLVVTGGWGYPNYLADTWEFDGTQWHEADARPEPTFDHRLAADPATGRLLLCSYRAGSGAQTFERTNGDWVRYTPSVAPPELNGGLAFDPVRGSFTQFGGAIGSTPSAQHHDWIGGNWVLRAGPVPPARYGHAMAVDLARNRIVVFGGIGATQLLDDTWEWNGSTWSQVATPVRPPARAFAGMAFDPANGQLLLYGGLTGYQSLSDMWLWNGVSWTSAGSGPGQRDSFAMALDPGVGRIVVHGGVSQGFFGSGDLTDSWEWNGTQWSALPGTTALSKRGAMAFDGQHLLLFGGMPPGGNANDPSALTLRLRRQPATSTSFGTGCAVGAPPTLQANTPPFVGDGAFAFTIAGAAPQSFTWLAASDVAAATQVGVCTVWIGQPLGFLVAPSSLAGVARHALALPPSSALVGASLHWQAVVWNPAGPLFGLDWTPGLTTRFGS